MLILTMRDLMKMPLSFFTFGIILARAFAFRMTELFTEDGDVIEIIITIILSTIIFFPVRKAVRRNMVDDGLDRPIKALPQEFYVDFLPKFTCLNLLPQLVMMPF